MKKNRTILQTAGILFLASIFFSSSSCEHPVTPPPTSKNDLAVVSMVTNSDGQSGTCWLQLTDADTPKTLDNSRAVQMGFGMPPIAVVGNDIYTAPDYGQSNTMTRWTRSDDGTLTRSGDLELPVSSFATHGVFYSKDKAYLSSMTGKLLIFDPSKMELTGELDLSEYANPGVSVPQFGAPRIDGDLMYLPLWQVNAQRQPVGDPAVDMLIIDVKTDQVRKRIQETTSGLANAGYPYGIQKNSFKDEKGDIYFIAGGAFSLDETYKTGILRIKTDTQEIDSEYSWVLNDQPIEGESGKTRWLAYAHYLGDGKLYGMADLPEYWSDPAMPSWTRDRSLVPVVIDIYQKTVKKLPLPRSCAYATHVSPYNDLLLFSVWGDQDTGFYSYDPKTGRTSDGALIKMAGFPFWAYQFK